MLLSTFANTPVFKGRDTDGDGNVDTPANVYVLAFMQYMMELGAFALFVYAGFLMPSLRRARRVNKEREHEDRVLELRGNESI